MTRTNLTALLLGTFLALGATSPAFSADGLNSQAATGAPAIQQGQGQMFADNFVDLADDDVGGDIDHPNWTDEADNSIPVLGEMAGRFG